MMRMSSKMFTYSARPVVLDNECLMHQQSSLFCRPTSFHLIDCYRSFTLRETDSGTDSDSDPIPVDSS